MGNLIQADFNFLPGLVPAVSAGERQKCEILKRLICGAVFSFATS
jgi:hypothetical protein